MFFEVRAMFQDNTRLMGVMQLFSKSKGSSSTMGMSAELQKAGLCQGPHWYYTVPGVDYFLGSLPHIISEAWVQMEVSRKGSQAITSPLPGAVPARVSSIIPWALLTVDSSRA